ncbi:MAG TPA: STAS domain-containing protein [Pseudomonadota bacterium]|nr:STAS domain-containing protein [Pseudomonadota bacterium]
MSDSSQQIKVSLPTFDIEWNLSQGLNLWAGVPTLSMWLPTTTAGMMAGFERMVGSERFSLCMQLGGQESVDGDWAVISSAPSFEEGLKQMSEIAWPAGWGRWQLISLDREKPEVIYRTHNSWEGIYQKSLGVCWGSGMMAGKLAGITSRLLGVPCWAEQRSFSARGDAYDEFVVTRSELTPQARLQRLLDEGKAANTDLAVALTELKKQNEERERATAELREKLMVIERQDRALNELAAPIIQVWEGVLTLPILGMLDSTRAAMITDRLLNEIVERRARYAILDLTAVDAVDTHTADHLLRIVKAISLLGARAVITGIRAQVSQTMVSLGLDLSQIVTLRDLQEALLACMGWLEDERRTQAAQGHKPTNDSRRSGRGKR